jgi:hypothetical protein
MSAPLPSALAQAHSAALYNSLLKTQHEILLSELGKLEALNEMVVAAREKRTAKHEQKMAYYRQTQELLLEEVRRKDEVIRRLAVIGLHAEEQL